MTPQETPGLTTSATGEAGWGDVSPERNQPVKSPPVDFTFHVNGTAAPQGSKKAFQRGKKIVLVEMSKNLPAWRAEIIKAARATFTGEPMDFPVSVQATFRIPKPKTTRFHDYPAGPADLDKLCRSLGDGLEIAGVLTNDSRIVHWDAAKVWGDSGATITITEMRTT